MFARIASAPPWVNRPLSDWDRVAGSPESRAAISSLSMKVKSSWRVLRGRCAMSVVVTIGTPPNISIRM